MNEGDRNQSDPAGYEAEAVRVLASDGASDRRKKKCEGKTYSRVQAKADATPLDAGRIEGRGGLGRTENVPCDGDREVKPHAKKSKPGEDLHGSKLAHGLRHHGYGIENFRCIRGQAAFLGLHATEGIHVLWGIFLGGDDRPQDRPKEYGSTGIEREANSQRNGVSRHTRSKVEPIGEHPRQR